MTNALSVSALALSEIQIQVGASVAGFVSRITKTGQEQLFQMSIVKLMTEISLNTFFQTIKVKVAMGDSKMSLENSSNEQLFKETAKRLKQIYYSKTKSEFKNGVFEFLFMNGRLARIDEVMRLEIYHRPLAVCPLLKQD